MAVIAPIIGAPLLGLVPHLAADHWCVGAPFYFGAMLQLTALILAFLHFRRQYRKRSVPTAAATVRQSE